MALARFWRIAKSMVSVRTYMENATVVPQTETISDFDVAHLTRLKRWRASTFLVMLIGYIGYYLCRSNLSSALPLLSTTFGYTNAQLGLIGLYSEMAYAIGKFIN